MSVQKQKSLLIFFKKHLGSLNYWLGRLILIFSFCVRVSFWAASLAIKKMVGKKANRDLEAFTKSWAVFKFCALGVEPKRNGYELPMCAFLQHLKEITKFIFAASYTLLLTLSYKKPRRVVIYYHGVSESDVMGFRKQMAYLAKKFSVVKPSEVKIAEADRTRILAAITFDDALVNVMENAVPILKEYALTAAIFAPVDYLGQIPRWEMEEDCPDKNELVMTRKQIIELGKDGFEICSHTLSHPKLAELEDDKLFSELKDSKQILEEMVGHEVIGISYPYGSYDDRVCQAAKETGYRLGFTIEPCIVDTSTDNMQIGRFIVSPKDSLIKFRLKVSGAYQVVKYLRTLKKMLVPA